MSARLLIVDDEVPQMTALCEMLLLEGYQATGHHSPQQALGSLKRGDYDLLLTDLMMPAMDGVELILAARKVDPDIAGVVMTGHGTVDTAVAAMRAGALDYVLKPFRLNVILGVVHRALELRRLRLENAALQQQERENAEQLAIAYRDLETFSYSVSHDLRAPLRAIRGFTDIFFSEFGATTPPEGQRQLALIAAGAERMDRIIDDLLKFCRFSRVPIAPRRVDLHKIAERAVAELRSCEPSRQVEVRIGNLPPCEGDPSLLEQVLVNLISNAFKYTRRKPVAHIEIDGFERPVDSTGSPSEYVYFVRDNGAGFDMRFASKLFGVFQRLHSQEEFTGNGVGLSIVQRILQRHGGRIWAESTVDEGATFFFVIPVLTE